MGLGVTREGLEAKFQVFEMLALRAQIDLDVALSSVESYYELLILLPRAATGDACL